VKVEFLRGSQMCSSTGSITQFTFLLPVKSWSNMTVVTANGLWGDILAVRYGYDYSRLDKTITSHKRTKETVECSNRGYCDTSQGLCNCFDGYTSSDGMGNIGNRGDCGYMLEFNHSYPLGTGNRTYYVHTPCPFVQNKPCTGHGKCSNLGKCECDVGYGK
jgi:hypothetical protein